jgi:hypothetical protein
MDIVADKLEVQVTLNRALGEIMEWNKDWMKDWQLDTPTNVLNSSRYRCFTEVETRSLNLLASGQEVIKRLRLPDGTRSATGGIFPCSKIFAMTPSKGW